jgi:hypothetical protein
VIRGHRNQCVGKPDLSIEIFDKIRYHSIETDVYILNFLAVRAISMAHQVGSREADRQQVRDIIGSK